MIDLQTDFDKHDSNGDGSLSRDELKQTMIKMGARDTSDANVNRVMKFYDFDGDGRISLREAQSGAVSGAEALIETGR